MRHSRSSPRRPRRCARWPATPRSTPPPRDAAALARQIERVLEDEATRERLAAAGPRARPRSSLGGRRGATAAALAEAAGGAGAERPRRAIGIDARKLKDFGIGSYIRNLLEAIAQASRVARATASASTRAAPTADALPDLPAHFEVVEEDSPGYSVAELTRFAWRLLRDRLDLFHATHYVLPPLRKPAPS